MRLFIGIDPGQSGGIGFIPEIGEPWAVKMPESERDLFDVLNEISMQDWEPFALIEQVSAMPGQGVTSCFTFGQGYGSLRMALIASGVPFETVRPVKWQDALKCRTGGDKNVSKAKAQELFPKIKITHKIADALLIAEFCRRTRI